MRNTIQNNLIQTFTFYRQDISSYVSKERLKVIAIAALAFACLGACYFLIRNCLSSKAVQVLDNPPAPDDNKKVLENQVKEPIAINNEALENENQELKKDLRQVRQSLQDAKKEADADKQRLEKDLSQVRQSLLDANKKADTAIQDKQRLEKSLSQVLQSLQDVKKALDQKLQAAQPVSPISTIITAKTMRVVLVGDYASEEQWYEDLGKEPGAPPFEFLTCDQALARKDQLQKGLAEGTHIVFRTIAIGARFENTATADKVNAFDSVFDRTKTGILLVWGSDATALDRSNPELLMPPTVFIDRNGTKVSRVVTWIIKLHPNKFMIPIVANPVNALAAAQEKIKELVG